MKIYGIILILCAASTPICYSMQLALKKNPHIKKIALQKELYATSRKQNKQKDVQCNNGYVLIDKGQIKDLVIHSANNLQSRLSTYGSNFFVQNKRINTFLAANVLSSVSHVSFALAHAHPGYLFPIIFNVAIIKAFKLQDTINKNQSSEEARLATELVSCIKEIERSRELLKDLGGVVAPLHDYEVINNAIIKPFLPVFNKHKNMDLEKCSTYIEDQFCKSGFIDLTVIGASLIAFLYLGSSSVDALINALVVLPSMLLITDSNEQKYLAIAQKIIKTYKSHLEEEKNSIAIKTAKNNSE